MPGTFDTARTNGPACCLIGRVLHVRFTFLQMAQFLLGFWAGTVSAHPCQVREHPGWSLVFEPMEDCCQPVGGQSAACGSDGLADLTDKAFRMRKIQNAHRIGTMVVDQPRPPLRSILHRAHLCRPFQPPPICFDQRCHSPGFGVSQPRKRGDLLGTDLSLLVARDLPNHQRLDARPTGRPPGAQRLHPHSTLACPLPQALEAGPA